MDKISKIVQECQDYVYSAVEKLNDEDYMEVLQDLASSFQSSVDAKQGELDNEK